MEPMSSQPAPYAGLRVIEIADDVGGEFLGRMLAEMGADVLKLEPAEGSRTRRMAPFAGNAAGVDTSLTYWLYNSGKRSRTLRLGAEFEEFDALLADADILITTLSPSRLAELGIDLSGLHDRHPRLIIASMTGWGLTGPWADYATSNLVAMAAGGPLGMCGYDDLAISPINPGGDQAYHTATAFAHIGVLVALLHRQQTGEGQLIDLSVHSSAALNTELGNPFWFYNGVNVRRQTCRHAQPVMTQSAMFECMDGSYIYYTLILADQHSWKILVAWMEEMGMAAQLIEPEYADVVYRQEHMGEIQDLVECFFLVQNGHDAYLEGQRRGLPIGIVNAPEDLLADEHLAARAFFEPVDFGGEHGEILFPGDSYRFSAFGSIPRTRAPRLGEHDRDPPWLPRSAS